VWTSNRNSRGKGERERTAYLEVAPLHDAGHSITLSTRRLTMPINNLPFGGFLCVPGHPATAGNVQIHTDTLDITMAGTYVVESRRGALFYHDCRYCT
jgi:hypothetical protein